MKKRREREREREREKKQTNRRSSYSSFVQLSSIVRTNYWNNRRSSIPRYAIPSSLDASSPRRSPNSRQITQGNARGGARRIKPRFETQRSFLRRAGIARWEFSQNLSRNPSNVHKTPRTTPPVATVNQTSFSSAIPCAENMVRSATIACDRSWIPFIPLPLLLYFAPPWSQQQPHP